MNEYIDRTALKKRFQKRLIRLEKYVHSEFTKGLFYGCGTDMSLIDEFPAADVVEVRHGRWIFEPGKIPYCSECKEYSDDGDKGAAICPWCGTRMDKEDEHEVS